MTLAERFNGEIINGDALQMYEGLPITTNKIPISERKGIPHHLMDCVKLSETPWTVRQFHKQAQTILCEIRQRGKLPILVGGTHYYTQSLLFPKSIIEKMDEDEYHSEAEEEKTWPILAASTEEMFAELLRIDPVIAGQWHPSDRRKIRRSLQIWLQTGKKASQVYSEQGGIQKGLLTSKLTSDSSGTSHEVNNPLIFWTHSAHEELVQRLNARVERMTCDGLIDEASSMSKFLAERRQERNFLDDTRGIWIAIGLKEMLPYVEGHCMSEADRNSGIERTKIATSQYARRQSRWIRLKLLPAVQEAALHDQLFLLDSTHISNFSSAVEQQAIQITQAFLAGEVLPRPESLSAAAKEILRPIVKEEKLAHYCEPCGKTMMSPLQWTKHLQSKGHKKVTKPRVDWRALYTQEHIS